MITKVGEDNNREHEVFRDVFLSSPCIQKNASINHKEIIENDSRKESSPIRLQTKEDIKPHGYTKIRD